MCFVISLASLAFGSSSQTKPRFFDAPILQVMYLDKPMTDHNLLQAICRTNRTYGQEKTHGLIVNSIGIVGYIRQY